MHRLHQKAEFQINTLVKRIRNVLRRRKSRVHKRGFVDFVGDVAHSLFGIARDSDIQVVQERVKTVLESNQRILGQFETDISKLASATSITNQRLDSIHSRIADHDRTLSDMTRALKLDFKTSLQLSFYMAETLYNFTCLEMDLQTLLLSVESLMAGRLEATLLHKTDISRVLVQLTRHLRTSKIPVRLLVQDPSYFYRANTHLTVFKGNIIYITLKIPITTLPYSLNLFTVTVVPKSIGANNQHASLLDQMPRYFAVASDNQTFSVWNDLPSLQVAGEFRIIFREDIQLTIDPKSCILALYKNDIPSVQLFCKILLLNNRPTSFVYLLHDTMAIENSVSDLTLICPTVQPKLIAACISCVIFIPIACTLMTDSYFFPASCSQHVLFNETSTVVHTFNLAVIQEFFSQSDWDHLQADSTLAQQLTLLLPTFVTGTNSSDNLIDQRLTEDFASAMTSVKEGQVLFKSQEDVIRDQLDTFSSPILSAYSSSKSFILPIGSALFGLLTMVTIYLVVKVHRLSVIILSLPRVVPAQSVPSLWIFSPSSIVSTPVSTITTGLENFPWFEISVISLLVLMLFGGVVRKLCKHCVTSSSPQAVFLAIHIGNATNTVVLPWHKLRFSITDYEIMALSAISQVRLKRHCLWSSLHFNWQVAVLHKHSQIRIVLPQSLRISCSTAGKLRHIIGIHKRYYVKLFISSTEFTVPLALDVSADSTPCPYSPSIELMDIQSSSG